MILDEATASLDPENEVYVQQAINRLIRGKTVLVIAHRLRTVLSADHIVVLDRGKIAEQGRAEDLLAAEGLFSRLFHIQQEAADIRFKANP